MPPSSHERLTQDMAVEQYVQDVLYAPRREYVRRLSLLAQALPMVTTPEDWERVADMWEQLAQRRRPEDGVRCWDRRVWDAQGCHALMQAATSIMQHGLHVAECLDGLARTQRRGAWWVAGTLRWRDAQRAAQSAQQLQYQARRIRARCCRLAGTACDDVSPTVLPGHELLRKEARRAQGTAAVAHALATGAADDPSLAGVNGRRAAAAAHPLARAAGLDPQAPAADIGAWVHYGRRARGDAAMGAYLALLDDRCALSLGRAVRRSR